MVKSLLDVHQPWDVWLLPVGHTAWGLAHTETSSPLTLGKQKLLSVNFCYSNSMQLDVPIQITLSLRHICKWLPDQLLSSLKRNYCQNWKCAWFAKGKGRRRWNLRTRDLNLKEKRSSPLISQTAFCCEEIYAKPIKCKNHPNYYRGNQSPSSTYVRNVETQLCCAPECLVFLKTETRTEVTCMKQLW